MIDYCQGCSVRLMIDYYQGCSVCLTCMKYLTICHAEGFIDTVWGKFSGLILGNADGKTIDENDNSMYLVPIFVFSCTL